MTQDEARRYCEERGIGPVLTRDERKALTQEDFRMFAAAYPGDPSSVSTDVSARVNESMVHRVRASELHQASGL